MSAPSTAARTWLRGTLDEGTDDRTGKARNQRRARVTPITFASLFQRIGASRKGLGSARSSSAGSLNGRIDSRLKYGQRPVGRLGRRL